MRSLTFLPAPLRPPRMRLLTTASRPTACHRAPAMAPAIPTFSAFFTDFFDSRHPAIAPRLRREQAAFAATVYLFRYDTRLSLDFITRNVDALSRAIADVSGKSIPEARRLFTAGVRDAAREYFNHGWGDIPRFIHANTNDLTAVHVQSTRLAAITDQLANHPAPDVDPALLQRLLDQRLPVMLMIYADYCSVCKQVRPQFEQASTQLGNNMFFVKLNGPRSPHVKDQYPFTSYPTILRCDNTKHITPFPKAHHNMTVQNLVAFAKNHKLQPAPSDDDDSDDDIAKFTKRRSRTYEWESALKRQGIDEIEALREERKEALRPDINALNCNGNLTSCPIMPIRSHNLDNGDPPPLCVLLGGGMGAGKTTAIGLISETPFWQQHGSGVVIVEADAFKLNDPLFHVLQTITPLASRIVHQDSIAAAEQLFLKAVNARRDVIFDGTLSWSEYAQQTVDMLRDTQYYWQRGPGYVERENGAVEQYWVRCEKRKIPAVPYRIELVGVTAHPEISVMRGIVRKITTGRAVPVQDQLKSHALFSKHFEEYIDMVDAAYLFDTTIDESVMESKDGYENQLVAIKSGLLFKNPDSADDVIRSVNTNEFVVRSPVAYKRFLKKKFLNINAQGTEELYDSKLRNQ